LYVNFTCVRTNHLTSITILLTMNQSGEADLLIQIQAWSLGNTTEDAEEDVYLGTEDVEQWQSEDSRWSLNTILIISLGPLGVVLLVSYIIHWYQVSQKILNNKKLREMGELERQHPKASAMLSIRALERETGGTFKAMAVDRHDEYGIKMVKELRLSR
jgi:hypothetical protein